MPWRKAHGDAERYRDRDGSTSGPDKDAVPEVSFRLDLFQASTSMGDAASLRGTRS